MTKMYGNIQLRNIKHDYYAAAKYHLLYTLPTIYVEMFISRLVTRCTKTVAMEQDPV